jgi:hypothetical protein
MSGLEPLVIPAILAGTAVTAVTAVQQGRAQERSAKANAEFNAKVARDEAAQKAAAGRLEADRLRRQRIRLTGSQRVGFAKSGVTTEGTPIDVMIKSAAEEELNANLAQHNFDVSAGQSLSQASLFDFRRKQASRFSRAGNIQAGASLLSGVASAGKFRASQKKGA